MNASKLLEIADPQNMQDLNDRSKSMMNIKKDYNFKTL